MLQALKHTLNINEPFDACVWAMAACAFWGMIWFGEISVITWNMFDGKKHLKHCDTPNQIQRLFALLVLPRLGVACLWCGSGIGANNVATAHELSRF